MSSVYTSQTDIVEHITLLHKAAPGEHVLSFCFMCDGICSDNIHFRSFVLSGFFFLLPNHSQLREDAVEWIKLQIHFPPVQLRICRKREKFCELREIILSGVFMSSGACHCLCSEPLHCLCCLSPSRSRHSSRVLRRRCAQLHVTFKVQTRMRIVVGVGR